MGSRASNARRCGSGQVAGFALVAALCLGAPVPLSAAEAEGPDEVLIELEEVIVYGTDGKLIQGMHAESELDAAGIAAYGANTVGDLLAQVAPDVDNTEEGPVILINGRPATGIRSVNDLPSESVQSVQVLPPQAASALGYGPTRRVINVVLRQSFRQDLANVTVRGATAGRGRSSTANLSRLRLSGNSFGQFALRASKTEPLLEAHRDVRSQPGAMPYDLTGNVLSWPVAGGDIDPALSAMTGYPVTVLGVPGNVADPDLADFMPLANLANTSDMGRYRTLLADQYGYGINANLSRPLGRYFFNMNFNADRSETASLTGATGSLLHVPASSPFSPFSQDVAVARYLGEPLRQHSDPTMAMMTINMNRQFGRWRVAMDSTFNWRSSTTVSERRVDTALLQQAIDAGTVDPFGPLPPELLDEVSTDRAKSRTLNGSLQLQASGTLVKLPAGNATASLRAEMRRSQQRSRTLGTTTVSSLRTRRDEAGFLSLQLPLLGGGTPQGFGLAAELNGTARDVTAVGTLFDHGHGINWRVGNRVTMRVNRGYEKVAPGPDSLTNPVITIDDFRTYDFIRQETVLVRYITGGNPDLRVEQRRTTRIGGTLRPLARMNMNFNLDYLRTVGRNATQPLPAVSEDVQIAFPDRYRRDADGRLVEIDARLVSFARSETEQIRWGGNFRRVFGAPPAPPQGGLVVMISDASGVDELSGAGWRLNANFTHTWQLTNTRLAREGLPVQDLLAGGAGNGNGQSRHNVQGRVGLAYNGTGLQWNLNWKSRTRITAGTASDPNDIVFDPFLRVDMSAFANLGTVFPDRGLLKDVRVTLAVDNLFDEKQRVTDEAGATPLRYQPYLINALGRVVGLSLRKAF